MRKRSSLNTEFLEYSVTATDPSGAAIDLSTRDVEVAYVAPGTKPVSGDWRAATWLRAGVAGLLVGPANGGTVLPVGRYDEWLRVSDNPEQPTAPVSHLQIT